MKPTQSRRPLAIRTALGPDALLLTRFSFRERLSSPFEIEADLAAVDANTDFNQVVGHRATIELKLGKKGTRYFNGYVSRLVQTGNRGGFARYRATIVPWIWFLTRTSDCRAFQRKSVLDITEEVFNRHRFGSDFYQPRTAGPSPRRRYCVQYRETDFNFVNRLLENEGIYYWFEHTEKFHRMVLANSIGASQPAPGYETLEYHEVEQAGAGGRDAVIEWAVEKEVQPVEYQLKDFDFKKPSDPLKGKHETPRPHGMARFALYDYPGEYFEPDDAQRYAKLRLEELQARHEIVRGVTTAMGLTVGGVFELQKHPLERENRKYLITDLDLTADGGDFASTSVGGEPHYSCIFSAIPSAVPFRPARSTPKPIIQGIQTATVVGPAGAEIHTDEHARVKVQFHWDRYGQKDENSSCFIRVSQTNAGKAWGSMITPRIGQEVLVEFIEGDPDRPIITGRVYNDEQKPPYAGGKGVVSGLKSQTHKGAGYNEMSMDDTAKKEKITIHGQYDMNTTVEHDQTSTIHNHRTDKVDVDDSETVGNNQTLHVVNNRTKNVDVNENETIGSNKTIQVGSNHTESIGKNMSLTVGMMKNESVGLASAENVGAAKALSIGAAYQVSVGAAMNETVGGAKMEEVGLYRMETVGGHKKVTVGGDLDVSTSGKHADSAMEIVVTGKTKILLQCGASQIEMTPGTITIKAPLVKINC